MNANQLDNFICTFLDIMDQTQDEPEDMVNVKFKAGAMMAAAIMEQTDAINRLTEAVAQLTIKHIQNEPISKL